MTRRALVGLFILFSVSLSWAQVPESHVARSVYFQLTEDFFDELHSMDAVVEPLLTRTEMERNFRQALTSSKPNEFKFENGRSWSELWPPQRAYPTPASANLSTEFEVIRLAQSPRPQEPHSIKNLKEYVQSRLGKHSADLIEKGQVVPIVLGGEESSIPELLGISPDRLYKIPSFYETWGLKKWMVPGDQIPDGKPRLIYVIPPSKEYLEHYQYMLSLLTGRQQQVVRSLQDYQNWKAEFAKAAKRIKESVGGKWDFLTLGYFNQWSQVKEHEVQLKSISLGADIRDWSGLVARKYSAIDQNTGKEVTWLALGHEKAIWGEASVELLRGFLVEKPRAVIFMGSAGSLSNKSQVYDLSVPGKFVVKSGRVEMKNFVEMTREQVPFYKQVNVVYGGSHGNTSSPAAQTLKYLGGHWRAGEDTLDVEQSLIAKSIAEFNSQTGSDIQFGAVNLITDKPMGDADHDLDKIDHNKKSQSRMAAVALALQAMGIQRGMSMSCGRVHLR